MHLKSFDSGLTEGCCWASSIPAIFAFTQIQKQLLMNLHGLNVVFSEKKRAKTREQIVNVRNI